MAGLLGESWDDPKTMATLQLAAGLLSPGSFGQGLGRGLSGYQNTLAADQDMKVKKAHLEDIAAQAVLRQQQAQREKAKYDYFMGGAPGGSSAASEALGAGAQASSVGPTMANAQRMESASPAAPRFGGVPEQTAMLDYIMNDGKNVPGMVWETQKPKREFQSGVLVDANAMKPGTSLPQISQNGTASQLIADASAPGGYRVILPQGAAQTAAANSIATKLPEALISAGTRREDFKNPDGTTRSVTGLQFGQQSGGLDDLNGLLEKLAQPQAAKPTLAPRVIAPRSSNAIAPATQAARDSDAVPIMNQELAAAEAKAKAGDPRAAQDVVAIRKEMALRKIPVGIQSGVSSQQTIANDAQGSINTSWLTNSYTPTVAKGDAAKDMLASVQTARVGLSSAGPTGWGKEAQVSAARVLAALGVPQAETVATGSTVFQQAAGARLNSVLQAATGVQTEGDAQRAGKMFASLQNTPRANAFILDMAQAIAERDQRRAMYYREALPLAQKNGDLQEVDRRWQRIEPSVWGLPIMQKWAK